MIQKKTTRRKTTAKKKPAKDLTVADGIAVHCACDQIVAMGKIKLYPANANKHPPKQVSLLAKLINRHGWRGPITISNQSGFVVRGHGRFAAAQLLEVSEIPVDFQNYKTEELERADRLADNKIHELSEWDRDLLRHELGELDSGVLDDTDLTGFTAPDLEELFTAAPPDGDGGGLGGDGPPPVDADFNPNEEVREKWGVEEGQLWSCGDHRLLCGDSGDLDDVKLVMDGRKAAMVFTDPPYGVNYASARSANPMKIKNDDISEGDLTELCKRWFDGVDFATTDGAYWMATVPPGPLFGVFFCDWKRRGVLRQSLVWVKNHFVLGHSEYHYKHEMILFGWKNGDRQKNEDRTKTSVWEFDKPQRSEVHPTMKPIDMLAYGISNHSRKGDIVYEPFSGSGTTIIACENVGRKCFAIELDPCYLAASLDRYSVATGKMPTLID